MSIWAYFTQLRDLCDTCPNTIHCSLCAGKMLFRDLSDRGLERKKETPGRQVLLQNMLEFIQKWDKAEVDGWHIVEPCRGLQKISPRAS